MERQTAERKREGEVENLKFVFLMPQSQACADAAGAAIIVEAAKLLLHCSKLAVAATARNIPHTTPSVRAIYS